MRPTDRLKWALFCGYVFDYYCDCSGFGWFIVREIENEEKQSG